VRRNLRRGRRRKTPILADARQRRIFVGRDEGDVVEFQMEVFDRLLNQVAIAIANVAELRRGNADKKQALANIAIARGLEPGIERLAVHLFFERGEDLYPGIKSDRRSNGERHAQSSMQNARERKATGAAKPIQKRPR
jgi:hypothetical protein